MTQNAPRARGPRRPASGGGSRIGLFLLLNILPLGVLAWVLIQHWRGAIVIREVPDGTVQNAIAFGVALVALVFVASISLPLANSAAKAGRAGKSLAGARWRGEAEGGKGMALLAWPFWMVIHLLAAAVRLVLILLTLALTAAVVWIGIRFWKPEVGQEWVDQALAWRPTEWAWWKR